MIGEIDGDERYELFMEFSRCKTKEAVNQVLLMHYANHRYNKVYLEAMEEMAYRRLGQILESNR